MMKVFICVNILVTLCTINGVSVVNSTSPDLTYTSYTRTPYCAPSEAIRYPTNVFEVQAIVLKALLSGKTVKAFGSRHSITDIICTDGIPIAMSNFNSSVLNFDKTVTFGGGIKIQNANEFLQSKNRALVQMPGYGEITIGGAVGTGAHGSSLKNTPSLSQQVVAVTIVDGLGRIRTIRGGEDLKAMKIHLGLLGIVISVTLQTVPLFKMTYTRTLESESILSDGTAIEWAEVNDYCQMAWFPSKQQVVVIRGNYTEVSTPGNAHSTLFTEIPEASVASLGNIFDAIEATRNTDGLHAIENNTALSLYQKVIGRVPICTEDGLTYASPCTGYAWRLLTSYCGQNCTWSYGANSFYSDESELASDVNELPAIVKTIKSILARIPAGFPFSGIAVRFHRQSDALMAIANRGPSVIFDVIAAPNRRDIYNNPKDGIGAYQAIAQALLEKHGGRPHWAKNGMYYVSKDVMEQTVPNRQKFIAAMKKYDPQGVFMNKFGRRLLGLSNDMDVDPKETHCALHDTCVCTSNSNCADNQECSTLEDVDGHRSYRVCKDLQIFTNKAVGPYDPYNLTSIFVAIF